VFFLEVFAEALPFKTVPNTAYKAFIGNRPFTSRFLKLGPFVKSSLLKKKPPLMKERKMKLKTTKKILITGLSLFASWSSQLTAASPAYVYLEKEELIQRGINFRHVACADATSSVGPFANSSYCPNGYSGYFSGVGGWYAALSESMGTSCICAKTEGLCAKAKYRSTADIGRNSQSLTTCGEVTNSTLLGVQKQRSTLYGLRLMASNLSPNGTMASDFNASEFKDLTVQSSYLNSAIFKNSRLLGTTYITGSVLSGADFSDIEQIGLLQFGSEAYQVNASGTSASAGGASNLTNASFARAKLDSVEMNGSTLVQTNFMDAKIAKKLSLFAVGAQNLNLNGVNNEKDGAMIQSIGQPIATKRSSADLRITRSSINGLTAVKSSWRNFSIDQSTGVNLVADRMKVSGNLVLGSPAAYVGSMSNASFKNISAGFAQIHTSASNLDFTGAHISNMHFSYVVASSKFQNMVLNYANILSDTYVYSSDFRNSKISDLRVSEGSYFYYNDLRGLIAKGAQWGSFSSCSTARVVNMAGNQFDASTDLRNAKFGAVNLVGSTGLELANLQGAEYKACTSFPAGFNPTAKGMILRP